MRKTAIALIFILALLIFSQLAFQPINAQVERVTTSCSIFVDDVVEGQPIIITIQIFPAPPSGEVFSNVSVGIVSPLQGISGNGPWDQKNIFTDSNGVAKVTFYIPTFGSPTNWNVWAYFGGQYLANNTLYYLSSHLESKFYISAAQTPTPSPTANQTLTPSPTPSATLTLSPSVPEFSWLTILALMMVMLFVAVKLCYRKTNIMSKKL